MALFSQTLSKEDLNILICQRITFECIPLVQQGIIEWGFPKPEGVKIIDHIKYLKILENSELNLKAWLRRNKKALERTNFESFDVVTLYNLLPVLCHDKIAQTGSKEWKEKVKDVHSIEYLLKELIDLRNSIVHDISHSIEVMNIETKRELMIKCIRTAGTLYKKDQSEIDAKIEVLYSKFDEIVQNTSSLYDNAVQYVTNMIEKECPSYMLNMYFPLFTVHLPGGLGKIYSSQICEPINLSVADEDVSTVFNCSEIFNHISNEIVIINGGPGSGKTVLMRNIFQNILENLVHGGETSYKGIGKFRVPIFVECRTERDDNLIDFLKESIPNINSLREIIYDAFKEVKGKVFIIDGYDEVNDNSRKLVDEIIQFCSKNNATCIISERVGSCKSLKSELQWRKLSYNEMLIEPISEMSDKLDFLRRYVDNINDNEFQSEELLKYFENLSDSVKKIFFSPIHFALFCEIFVNHRQSLFLSYNENVIHRTIIDIYCNDIERKLRERDIVNHGLKAKLLLEVFSDYSLRLFRDKKYSFDQEIFLSLVDDCLRIISKHDDVDIEWLFSGILTPEINLTSTLFNFTHTTIQEYFAAVQINKNLRGIEIDWNSEHISDDSLLDQFLDCLGVPTEVSDDEEEIVRYGNILKFLILETFANGEIANYTKIFSVLLWKFFRPKYMKDSLVYLLDLISSSNCDSTISSIVSNVLRNWYHYSLQYTRHIRPLTEVMKKRGTRVVIKSDIFDSLTDSDYANLGQLVSVLEDDCEISLNLYYSFFNYQPINDEFYSLLKDIKCKVTKFTGCVTTSVHLSIVMGTFRVRPHVLNELSISTKDACDVLFDTPEEYEGNLSLRVKCTGDCPIIGSNPVTVNTHLTVADIPAVGGDNVYRIIKYLCPVSKEFLSIHLDNCHLSETDTNDLLEKLEREEIGTNSGERGKFHLIVEKEDKSKYLQLYLADMKHREAEQQEVKKREAEKLEAEKRKVEKREAEKRKAAKREAKKREAIKREAEKREAERRKYLLRLAITGGIICPIIGVMVWKIFRKL